MRVHKFNTFENKHNADLQRQVEEMLNQYGIEVVKPIDNVYQSGHLQLSNGLDVMFSPLLITLSNDQNIHYVLRNKNLNQLYTGSDFKELVKQIKNEFQHNETFVPKNIEKRQIDFDKKQAEKPAKFKEFVKQFRVKLQSLQGLQVGDPDEQHFIDLMQDLVIVLDPQKFPEKPYVIFLYEQDRFNETGLENFYSFYYNWEDPEFYCMRHSGNLNKSKFEQSKYWSSHNFQIFLEKMVKKYLDLECWANVSGVHVR